MSLKPSPIQPVPDETVTLLDPGDTDVISIDTAAVFDDDDTLSDLTVSQGSARILAE